MATNKTDSPTNKKEINIDRQKTKKIFFLFVIILFPELV